MRDNESALAPTEGGSIHAEIQSWSFWSLTRMSNQWPERCQRACARRWGMDRWSDAPQEHLTYIHTNTRKTQNSCQTCLLRNSYQQMAATHTHIQGFKLVKVLRLGVSVCPSTQTMSLSAWIRAGERLLSLAPWLLSKHCDNQTSCH